ncbi:MAG: tetratricopeptide repeat protein [Planctomycetes bacterium]|nr:tetratricopeptide repeat protein [Planctomycetota bacterium]
MPRATDAPAAEAARPPRAALLPFVLILAAGLFAYWGVWRGEFRFDDKPAIVDNGPLLAGDWWHAAFGPDHQPLANRPLSCLSLVVDFQVHGPGPFGPHLDNLLLHLANALLLFVVVRATLQTPNLGGRFDRAGARWLAAAVATLWVVHPLGVDAVAYATQRTTLLFSGCLLLAVLGAVQAHGSARPVWWRALTVLALAAGMASKEEMVLAPVLVVLFDRAFLLPSWSALRARLGWYGAYAASWSVLWACVALGPVNPTVGYATRTPITAWQWLCTQAGVVGQYLRLSLWPQPLRGAYDWGIVTDVGAALLPGAVVLALLAATVACWRRRPWWGWLGSLFFLVLAPTSSVLPILTEIAAERRAYLPMLAVLVPVVFGVHRLAAAGAGRGRRVGLVAVAAATTIALAFTTRARVAVYRDSAAFWADAYAKRDPASRSFVAGILLANQGFALCRQGRLEAGYACYDEAMQCATPPEASITLYALSLLQRQRTAEAVALMRELVAREPSDNAWGTLGVCLAKQHQEDRAPADDARLAEAERALRVRLARNPGDLQCWAFLGYVLRVRGRLAEAADAYRYVVAGNADDLPAVLQLAQLLAQLGRHDEIAALFERLLAERPRDVALRLRLAQLGIQNGDPATAERLLQQVLQIEPGNGPAQALLRDVRAAQGR